MKTSVQPRSRDLQGYSVWKKSARDIVSSTTKDLDSQSICLWGNRGWAG